MTNAVECPSCGFANPERFRFCGNCGAGLVHPCPVCGAAVAAGLRFCGSCGAPTGPGDPSLQVAVPAPSPASQAERRRVTMLFADLVGYSKLAEEMDPEELNTLITGTFEELTAAVEAREGWVEKFIGDAIVATFGARVAHEDDPARALAAAMAMLEVVRRRSESMPESLQLRIGINSGLVLAGLVGDGTQTGVMGDPVNVAARLQQAAAPGEVLVSASVWRRVRDSYEMEPVGAIEVKGRSQTVEAYRVLSPRHIPGRRRAPFVGREQELALLELLWSSSLKGNTHVVSLIGEPGVGKSRLLEQFVPEDALEVRVRCGSERAFGPFLDVISSLLGGPPTDMAHLLSSCQGLGVDLDVAAPLGALFGLSDLPPTIGLADEQQKRQVFAAVWQFLESTFRDRPGCVVIDDAHWADRSSLDLLGFLLERLGGVSLMLVLAHRPGFEHVERAALRASHMGVRLELLSWIESVALARGYLGVSELPGDLERIVATRAEGNPFFIEELLQALLELGSLAVVDGRAVLARVDVEVPDTVQGTIVARLDRLGPRERSILQHAAVIGRTFETELLQAVLNDGDVSEGLEILARAELLTHQRPGRWTFKHSMIQEVAYETLLNRQRRELHRKVAEAIEQRSAEDGETLPLLAHHYAQARVPDKARQYALAAGDAAQARMGFAEGKELYQRALDLWGEGDEPGRLSLLMRIASAAMLTGDVAAARTALIEAASGWQKRSDDRQAGLALAMLGRVYFLAGETESAAEVFARGIALLERGKPSPELIRAHVWSSIVNMTAGRAEGRAETERALQLAEHVDLAEARAHLEISLGHFEVLGGDPAGVQRIERGLLLAEESGYAEAIGRGHLNIAIAAVELQDTARGVARCEEGRAATRKLGAASYEWMIAGLQAALLCDLGRYADSEQLAREALGQHRSVLVAPGIAWTGAALCLGLLRRGRYDEARVQLDEITPVARRIGGSLFLRMALLAEAELDEAQGNIAAARQATNEAATVVMESTSGPAQYRVAVQCARLGLRELTGSLLARAGKLEHPPFVALELEARGVLDSDANGLREAADAYREAGLPYFEARCRLDAGDLAGATEVLARIGASTGPLGARARGVRP
jgi:class 3 adenylate cyclase/tetratricopeptide (TPR) repeat protein